MQSRGYSWILKSGETPNVCPEKHDLAISEAGARPAALRRRTLGRDCSLFAYDPVRQGSCPLIYFLRGGLWNPLLEPPPRLRGLPRFARRVDPSEKHCPRWQLWALAIADLHAEAPGARDQAR
jgi:hypothetical protein